jgi:putative endonuclease
MFLYSFPCSASLEARTDPSLNCKTIQGGSFRLAEGKDEPDSEGGGQHIMIYYVYVLKSQKNGGRYTGFTRKTPSIRLEEHNRGINRWTCKNKPFDLIHFERFRSRKEALKKEKYFKSASGRRYLDKVL